MAAMRDRFRRRSRATDVPGAEDETPHEPDSTVDDAEDAEDAEWLEYDLHQWALESRVMLQQLLTVDQVVHSWQGTTLLVHESLEGAVDDLITEVEEAEQAREATSRPIGPEDDLTAFEIGEWAPEMRQQLIDRLIQAGVPHILEQASNTESAEHDDDEHEDVERHDAESAGEPEGSTRGAAEHRVPGSAQSAVDDEVDEDDEDDEVDENVGEREQSANDDEGGWDLWVREADEERVEVLIDELLAQIEEADYEELDGLELNALLSDMFVACDRLRRDPRDPDGVTQAVTGAKRLTAVRTPFGFSAQGWRDLRSTAGNLQALVEGEDTDAEDLRELAQELSETLRKLI